jgi:hypothetical protein
MMFRVDSCKMNARLSACGSRTIKVSGDPLAASAYEHQKLNADLYLRSDGSDIIVVRVHCSCQRPSPLAMRFQRYSVSDRNAIDTSNSRIRCGCPRTYGEIQILVLRYLFAAECAPPFVTFPRNRFQAARVSSA